MSARPKTQLPRRCRKPDAAQKSHRRCFIDAARMLFKTMNEIERTMIKIQRPVTIAASAFFISAMTAPVALAADETQATAWWQDTALWVSLGFVVVVAMLFRIGVHKTVGKSLDERAQKIADDLDDARRMREEAQELLAQYQRRQREVEEEAQAIIEQAKKDAGRMADESREKINDQIARRAKAAEDKIARAEAQALSEIRQQTADLAIETARGIIRDRVDQGAQSALIEKAIDDVRAAKH